MADNMVEGLGALGSTMAGAGGKPTKRRFLIMGMLFITVVINYLDRSNLSIASPHISAEFHLTPTQMGLIFSAFGWIYGPMCIPGGWLVDRIKPRIFYPATILLWSLATYGFGVSTGFAMLIAVRLLVGLFEVPSFLINNRIATTWFGENERATCVGAYTAAEYVGLAFLLPVLAWLLTTFGWPSVFFVTGTAGVIWSVLFFLLYREPRDMKGVNAAEIAYIASSGGIPDLTDRIKERQSTREAGSLWANLGIVLGRRKLWGLYIGEFCWATTNTFFLTWFPTYLVQYRHFSFIKAGFYGSVPFLAAFCRRHLLGAAVGLLRPARGEPQRRAQNADHRRHAARLHHHRRELRRQRAAGDHVHGDRLLRERPGLDPLVAGLRRGTGAVDRPDQRHLQLRGLARLHHHADHHRPSADDREHQRAFDLCFGHRRHRRRRLYFPGRQGRARCRLNGKNFILKFKMKDTMIMAKVAILGFAIESNRFAPVSTRVDFVSRCYLAGDRLLAESRSPARR